MNKGQIRIAIAQALEWTGVGWYEDNAGPPILHGFPPFDVAIDKNGEWEAKRDIHSVTVPDWPEDLNACREFEDELNANEQVRYALTLHEMSKSRHYLHIDFDCIHASAMQKCEAFLRVKGAWPTP